MAKLFDRKNYEIPESSKLGEKWATPPAKRLGSGMLISLITMLVMIVLMGIWVSRMRFITDMLERNRIEKNGVVAEGVISGLRSYDYGNDTVEYLTAYTFEDKTGDTYTREILVPQAYYDKLTEGMAVPVIYVVDDPQISFLQEIYTENTATLRWWVIPLLVLSVAAVFYFLLRPVIKLIPNLRQSIALDKSGRATQGTIIKRWDEESQARGISVFRMVVFEYSVPESETVYHAMQSLPEKAENLAEGDHASVIYLPDDPQIARLDPKMKPG